MKKIFLLLCLLFFYSSCVSKKQYAALKTKNNQIKKELVAVKNNLTKCFLNKQRYQDKITNLQATVSGLKKDKKNSLEQLENLTVLTRGANDNIKETLNQLSKKDTYINRIRAAASKKDSLNLVVAFHLKKALKDGINDDDIQISVEKTVVFISISDKLLFRSGSYKITKKASKILQKVATVINEQVQMDIMVEGHTDNTPIKTATIKDNWDLSVKRSTAIVRILQKKYGVNPSRLIAAGRSSYMPLVANDSPADKAKNRRTKIIILPKLNQFFDLLEQKVE